MRNDEVRGIPLRREGVTGRHIGDSQGPQSVRLQEVNGGASWRDRYYPVRSRIFFWVISAPLLILLLALATSVASDASQPTAVRIVVFAPLIAYLAVAIRMIFGWDLVVHPDHLVYRAAFRNWTIPRDSIERVVVEAGKSSARLNNLMVVNVYQHDSARTTLKLFNCFRPTAERPSPFGFQRMNDMAKELTDWLGTTQEQRSKA